MAQPWSVIPSSTYLAALRNSLDLYAGGALQYEGTPEGAWTSLIADYAWQMDQGVQQAISSLWVSSMTPSVLARIADARGVPVKPGVASRYTVRVTEGSGSIPPGSMVVGGGLNGTNTWTVLTTGPVGVGDDVLIESTVMGPVSISSGAALAFSTPVPGNIRLKWQSGLGLPWSLGAHPESPYQVRLRLDASPTSVGGLSGLRARLRRVPWIQAVDVRPAGAGQVQVTIAPQAVGADREEELAQILYKASMTGITVGLIGIPTLDAQNFPTTVYYSAGAVVAIPVEVTVESNGTVTQLEDAVKEAIIQYSQGLGLAQPVNRLDLISSINVQGVLGVDSLTVNGSEDNEVFPPGAADIFVLDPINVTVATP